MVAEREGEAFKGNRTGSTIVFMLINTQDIYHMSQLLLAAIVSYSSHF
jgi:hypothetical protein